MTELELRARDMLRRFPLIDGHNDLPWALRERVGGDASRVRLAPPGSAPAGIDGAEVDLAVPVADTHTDLPRLAVGGVGAQFWRGLDPRNFDELFSFKPEWERAHPRPEATLAQVTDHIEHVRAVAGVEHVGLGGDFDGTPDVTTGLEDVSAYPALLAELLRRGWSESDLKALVGGNMLRALRAAESAAAAAPR